MQIPLRPGLALDVGLAGDLNAGAAIDLMPPGVLRIDPPSTTAEVSGRARIGVAVTGVGGEPVTLLGIAGGSGLQAEKLRASVGSDLRWNLGDGKATGDVLIEVAVEDGEVVIDLSGADGFLSAILPDGGLRVPFDLLAGWSSSRGLYFEGGAGLAIDIPIDVELGPIKLQLLHLGFTISPDGLELEASGAVGAKLGPFALAVERMGTTAALTFPATGGNLGPADLDFAFKPPSGIGLALDAGVVKGGGYLFLDPDKGEYAGILELSFGPVSIKAIGILTTKMPGGEDGWALLLLVFGEFTAVQLGFGFTLNGVGGIIGLQHGVSIEALQSGLRTGVLDSVLFPRDPVANAPALIGQLRVVFPIVPRALTVGPALKLGWSTPALVTLSLGIILQFDDVLGSGPGSPSFTPRRAARPAQGAGPAGRRAGHRRPGPDPPPGRHPRRVRRAGAGALGRRRTPRLPRRAAARSPARWWCVLGSATTRRSSSPSAASTPGSPTCHPASRRRTGSASSWTTGSSPSASSGTSPSPPTPSRPGPRPAWSPPVVVSGWRPTSGSTRCSSSSRRSTSRSSSGSAPAVRYKSISLASLKVRGTISGPGPLGGRGARLDLAVLLRRRHRLRGGLGRGRGTRAAGSQGHREDRDRPVRPGRPGTPSCPAPTRW